MTGVIQEDPYENKSDFSDASIASIAKAHPDSYINRKGERELKGRIPVKTKLLTKKVTALPLMDRVSRHIQNYILQP